LHVVAATGKIELGFFIRWRVLYFRIASQNSISVFFGYKKEKRYRDSNVSGDKHLKNIEKYMGIEIVSPKDFLNMF